jgi:hypothetical protein
VIEEGFANVEARIFAVAMLLASFRAASSGGAEDVTTADARREDAAVFLRRSALSAARSGPRRLIVCLRRVLGPRRHRAKNTGRQLGVRCLVEAIDQLVAG